MVLLPPPVKCHKAQLVPLPVVEEIITKKSRIEAVLPVKKADILGRSAWDFRFKGKSITAKIDDDDFLETIHNGAAVKAGDYINAILEVEVHLDGDGKPIDGSEQYTVVSVHGGIQHDMSEQLNSVYTRSGQNSTPNSNATNLHSSQKRCCSFCISSSNASPTFQVQKSIFHQMTKPIQVTVILPLLLAISFSRNDDIHSSISGISNDLIGVIPTIGQ